jgi:hypothetical protein
VIAKTALEHYRMAKAEMFEENNSESAKFFDIQTILQQARTLLKMHFLGHPEEEKRPEYKGIMQKLEDAIEKASFPDDWAKQANDTMMDKMGTKSVIGWNYQRLNAMGRAALGDAEALMVHLGIIALESADEAEDRIEMEAYARPKKG